MQVIKDSEFGGERPLFGSHNLRLENVTIHAGESAIKNCSNIEAYNCRFEGKYPFWHVKGFKVENCLFTEGARAALWYSSGLEMRNTRVEAPKMFREMSDLILDHVEIPDAQETLWHCRKATLSHVTLAKGDYLFMHGADIRISDYKHQGNYSFQYCKNVEISNADIDSKDAFWNTEDVTLIDCRLTGEYLGWHSHRLKLVRCHISGTQPLCYAHDLILEDCTFDPACDLAFEDSSVNATIKGGLTSIKNPQTGRIELDSVGEIILDGNAIAPADCEIVVKGK
jgi:hypothetical protein